MKIIWTDKMITIDGEGLHLPSISLPYTEACPFPLTLTGFHFESDNQSFTI